IPRRALQERPEGEVRLSDTADQVKDLPRFQDAVHTAPPAGYASSLGYPGTALLRPVGYVTPVPTGDTAPASLAETDEVLRQRGVNLDNVVIDRGSDVIGQDGEKVGEVHSVTIDATTGRPTKIVVR